MTCDRTHRAAPHRSTTGAPKATNTLPMPFSLLPLSSSPITAPLPQAKHGRVPKGIRPTPQSLLRFENAPANLFQP